MPKKIAEINQKECVACGCCIKSCPKQAVTIFHGMYAEVQPELCVGCGKCMSVCPADVITLLG